MNSYKNINSSQKSTLKKPNFEKKYAFRSLSFHIMNPQLQSSWWCKSFWGVRDINKLTLTFLKINSHSIICMCIEKLSRKLNKSYVYLLVWHCEYDKTNSKSNHKTLKPNKQCGSRIDQIDLRIYPGVWFSMN